jgi:hypothetical protein
MPVRLLWLVRVGGLEGQDAGAGVGWRWGERDLVQVELAQLLDPIGPHVHLVD